MSMMRTLKFRLSFTIISILLLCGCVHSYEVSGFRHSHNNLEPPPGRNSHLLPNATPASVRNCPSNYSCSAVGTCVNGVCVCWYGRSGFDCSEVSSGTPVVHWSASEYLPHLYLILLENSVNESLECIIPNLYFVPDDPMCSVGHDELSLQMFRYGESGQGVVGGRWIWSRSMEICWLLSSPNSRTRYFAPTKRPSQKVH